MLILPWNIIDFCVSHPLGHEHEHEAGKPTPCELRAQFQADHDGEVILPPMDCSKFDLYVDEYPTTYQFKLKPTTQSLIVAGVLFDLYKYEYTDEPDPLPPDPQCRSEAFISVHQLRGPPLV